MNKNIFFTLDGIRGVVAIAVVIWHAEKIFGFRPASGYLAVDLFFCLSGFVLEHSYGERLRCGRMSIADFFITRVIRLYPLYILGVIIMIFGVLVSFVLAIKTNWNPLNLFYSTICSALMIPSPPLHSTALFPLNNPAWSLFFELVANFVFVVVIRLGEKKLLGYILFFSAISLMYCVYLTGTVDMGSNWGDYFGGIPRVLWSFFVGVYIYRMRGGNKLRLNPVYVILFVVFVISYNPAGFRAYYDLLCVILLLPLVVLIGSFDCNNILLNNFQKYMGKASYPIYVLHIPLLAFLNGVFKNATTGGYSIFFGVLFIFCFVYFSNTVISRFDVWFRANMGVLVYRFLRIKKIIS